MSQVHYPLYQIPPFVSGGIKHLVAVNNPNSIVRSVNPRNMPAPNPPIAQGFHNVGVKERETQVTGLKKENFGLKMRIFYLQQNIQFITPDNMHKVLMEHAELKALLETMKQEGLIDAKNRPTGNKNYSSSRDALTIDRLMEKLGKEEGKLAEIHRQVNKYADQRQMLVRELKEARRSLRKSQPHHEDMAFIVEGLQIATHEIDLITLNIYENL